MRKVSNIFVQIRLQGNFHKALELREKNPCLKVLIAIGGEWISSDINLNLITDSSGRCCVLGAESLNRVFA